MNIITIFYKRRDPGKFFELMAVVDDSAIKQEWNNADSTYKIFWEWPQKEDVLNLLSFLKETFLDARIAIENDVEEETTATPEENTVKIQDVQKEDIVEADSEEENVNEDKAFVESEDEKDKIQKEEENLCEDVNPSKDADKTEENASSEEPSETSEEAVNEEPQEMVETTEVKEEEAKENPVTSETTVVSENIPKESDEKNPEEKKIEDDVKSSNEPAKANEVKSEECPVEEIKKVMYNPNEELKRILTPYFEKYDFTEKFCDSAEKFCADQGIKSEAFCRFFALCKTAPTVEKLYAGVTRIVKQNSALVKIEVKKNFEKFLKSIEPEIFDKCPEITVVHFLNVFREENRKF